MTTDHAGIDLLAATAYETGIDPIDYAVEHVIQAHVDMFLGARDLASQTCTPLTTATVALSRLILADLLGAGWKPPEVTR